jgi:polyhydroxybutyrate depolymerase
MALSVRIIALSALMVSITLIVAIASEEGHAVAHELVVGGSVRKYTVYRPATADEKGLPLMIVLHGGLGKARLIEKMTGMDDVADKGRFIVAYPEGTATRLNENLRTWNAGGCCGLAARQDVDDVRFISRMIDDIHARYSIDTRRVYVAGLSNGAMMAYRLACEIPDKIAAVIAVSGTLAVGDCNRAKDIPVLHIHGDEDRNVPFAGGRGEESISAVDHRSVPATMNLLTRARQCAAPEQKKDGNVEIFSYHCRDGAPVTLYVIKGGKHGWPGAIWRDKTGAGQTISASKLAWEFAKQFAKK